MTPLQQAYLGKLRATADANMAFFEKNSPFMHLLLTKESPKATVDISDQGDLAIRYEGGESISVTEDILRMEGRLVRFADVEDRPQLLAFHKLRAVAENPDHGTMQRYHYSNLDAEFPNRVRRHFAEHYPDNSGLNRYPDFGGKDIPLVIVFGSGIGWHLPRLLLEYRIRHLIVIDMDVDAFRLSMFFQDYVLLSRLAMERGTDLTFIVQPDIDLVSRSLMSVLIRDNGLPPFFIHGAAMFYAIEENEAMETVRGAIVDTLWEMFFGLGYFDDELISIKHTFDNLRRGLPIYLKPNSVPEDAVAFIVGSGPSLDGLLPILREYGDRAVIFSCGTSLSGVANAGIRPDFHMEKERPYLQYEVITKTVEKDFLKGIRFLGLNVVHPDVFGLFETSGVILKAADTMALLLAQHGIPREVILHTQPTVTNTAIDFALSVGFKQIYLFGVDMGYKDKEKHHSRHTFYLHKIPEEDHLQKLLSKHPPSHAMVPGNFGGEVSTTKILSMSRQMMGYAVKGHPSARVYNLNDGAQIDGAIPLHAEDFVCHASPASKTAAIAGIVQACQNSRFDLPVLEQALLDQLDSFIAEVSDILAAEQQVRADVIDKLSRVYRHVRAEEAKSSPCALLFRGVLSHLLSLTFNAITIIKDEDEAVAKAEFDFANLMDFLEQARAEVVNVMQAGS